MQEKTKGQILRDKGIKTVTENSQGIWKDTAYAILCKRASKKGSFNYDDIEQQILDEVGPPHHPNAIGALMRHALQEKIIVEAGYRQARRPSAHARNVKIYVGINPKN